MQGLADDLYVAVLVPVAAVSLFGLVLRWLWASAGRARSGARWDD